MDHAICRGSCIPKAVEIVERAAMHLRSGGGEGSGRSIRASEPDDPMARADELGNDGGADPAGCAGDEDTHERPPVVDVLGMEDRTMSVTVISVARIMSVAVIE
jgi:hypothetical protein